MSRAFGGLRRFLSTTFGEPLGSRIDPTGVRGYYVDLSVKASDSARPPDGGLPAAVCQWGLGAFERHLAGEDGDWLAAAVSSGEWLLREQSRSGSDEGGWVHHRPMPHTFPLEPPWLSGLAQGQGASLLVRLHLETGRGEFAEAAKRALLPLAVPSGEGGVKALLDGHPFPEEYPTDPPSFVLNGAIFALFGCRDVAAGLGDEGAGKHVPRRRRRARREPRSLGHGLLVPLRPVSASAGQRQQRRVPPASHRPADGAAHAGAAPRVRGDGDPLRALPRVASGAGARLCGQGRLQATRASSLRA